MMVKWVIYKYDEAAMIQTNSEEDEESELN